MRSISLPILVLALALHTCEMLLNALAWRNILRRAYPRSDVAYRVVLGGYGGGVALNSFLPAQAGTVAMLGIYRAQIQASTALGLVGAGVVQNAFYVVIGVAVCIALIATRQGALDAQFGSLYAHAVLVVVGAIVLGVVAWVRRSPAARPSPGPGRAWRFWRSRVSTRRRCSPSSWPPTWCERR